MVRDRESGKYKRVRLFVLTLGCSRKSVRLLALKSSSRVWAELHERAFRQLGSVPRVIVLDNLREGVMSSQIVPGARSPLSLPEHPVAVGIVPLRQGMDRGCRRSRD